MLEKIKAKEREHAAGSHITPLVEEILKQFEIQSIQLQQENQQFQNQINQKEGTLQQFQYQINQINLSL